MFDDFPSVRVLVVSYDTQDALRKTLEEHKIEVVLSTLSPASGRSMPKSD